MFKKPFIIMIACISIGNFEEIKAQNSNSIQYTNATIEESDNYRIGSIYQKDLLLFFNLLQSTHPAFTVESTPPFNIEQACTEGYKWAINCQSKNELRAYLQRYASKLNDGHTGLMQNFNSSLLYPINYQKLGDNYYLYITDKEYEAHLGKQIVEINSRPISEVIDSFRSMISCDNDEHFYEQLKNHISLEDFWTNNPYKSPDSMLLLTFSDKSKVGLRAVAKSSLSLVRMQHGKPTISIRQPSKSPFIYQILPNQKICYLQFQSCVDQSTERLRLKETGGDKSTEQIENYLAKIPRFDHFLSNMFDEVQANGIETLVIDVRNNGGGNSKLCDLLLSWLKPIDQTKQGGSSIRFSILWEKSYPKLSGMIKQEFQRRNTPYELGKIYNQEWLSKLLMSSDSGSKTEISHRDTLFVKNRDLTKVFKGNIVFIQNARTYSSAGMLITSAVDNSIGSIIGSQSTYNPCNYGDLLFFDLPNTGLQGYVSHKIFERPDSSKCRNNSIIPDQMIDIDWDTFVSGNDLYWSWILNKYGK